MKQHRVGDVSAAVGTCNNSCSSIITGRLPSGESGIRTWSAEGGNVLDIGQWRVHGLFSAGLMR